VIVTVTGGDVGLIGAGVDVGEGFDLRGFPLGSVVHVLAPDWSAITAKTLVPVHADVCLHVVAA